MSSRRIFIEWLRFQQAMDKSGCIRTAWLSSDGSNEGDTWTHLSERRRSDGNNEPWLTIVAHNCGSIVARSRSDQGWFIVRLRPRSSLADGPRSSCDRGHQTHLPTGSNSPEFARKIPFKNRCIPSCFLNSWLNREGIKWFERKILSSSWSPAFRLDFDQNQSGIDHEFHRISSDFPLERRTSTRKKSSRIRFNPSELKPDSCGNRVSSEILSIIKWQFEF